MKRTKKQVIKSDVNRVVLTETIPYEMPIIISNEGFYHRINQFKEIQDNEKTKDLFKVIDKLFIDRNSPKVPFHYEIVKNSTESRLLSLAHPSSQYRCIEFYEQYSSLILEFCSRSPLSLRYPSNYASVYYIFDKNNNHQKYRSKNVEGANDTFYSEYSSSFFSYSNYTFLQSFLESKKYIELECSFNNLRMLDISNCFGNIYTHSISWATKPRNEVKEIISNGIPTGGFDHEFDLIMQKSNLNETNGILVGAELSRIFTEVILQKIDIELVKQLEENDLTLDVDYKILRYMDDYFVYSNKQENADYIEMSLARLLREFKLSLNLSKKIDYVKPFITNQTKADYKLKETFSQIVKMIDEYVLNKSNYLPHTYLYKNILSKLRIEIHSSGASYQDASKYILKEIRKYIDTIPQKYADTNESVNISENKLVSLILLILELSFYLYLQDKRYLASTLICQISISAFESIKLIEKMFNVSSEKYEELKSQVTNFISEKLFNILQSTNFTSGIVEFSNFICLFREIDASFEIQNNYFEKLIKSKNLNYFSIVSLLYFFRNDEAYGKIKLILCKKVANNILAPQGVRKPIYHNKSEESELLHLFCDFMSCPFVDDKFKKSALKNMLSPIGLYSLKSEVELLDYFSKNDWFVSWGNIDFRNFLRKKRLKSTY